MSKVIRRARLSGAGLDFTLSNVEDEAGLYQGYLTDLAGWFGGVGVSANDSQRPLGHGLFASRSFRTGREITLSGTLVFRSESDRLVADRFLSGLLWDGEFGTLTVDTDDVSASAVVKLSGEVQHSYYGTEAVKVQIPLTAPDPFLYGPARQYQLYPAGFGEGLDYNLFGGVPLGENLAKISQEYPGVRGEYVAGYGRVVPTTTTTSGTNFIQAFKVTPGETYQVTHYYKADKPGSGHAVSINRMPENKNEYIVPAGQSAVVFPVSTEWQKAERLYTVPEGVDYLRVLAWVNHTNMVVQDAAQIFGTWVQKVDENEPVLDWGTTAPYSGAFGNSGNATSYPTFTVRGDWPGGFTLTESGRSLTFSSPVDESTPVVVDMKAGAVYVAGEDQTHRLTRRAWFGVEPGESIQPRITALAPSTGWCDVEIHDTYI